MELLKMLSANEVVAQIVSFLLLLVLLRTFAWKKLLGSLDARRDKIVSEFKAIEDTKAEIAVLKEDYEKRIALSEQAARARIQDAIAEGKKITEDVKKKAELAAGSIIEKANENIKYELDKAKAELKDTMIDMTILATEKIIQEKLTGDGDRKLVEEFLKRVDKIE
ncbi:MAG: F0F1 ATP synthase subunit B [Candidatus Omnitrophota bacterium]|jgi:F-type H+-transporting ATPase subunit b